MDKALINQSIFSYFYVLIRYDALLCFLSCFLSSVPCDTGDTGSFNRLIPMPIVYQTYSSSMVRQRSARMQVCHN